MFCTEYYASRYWGDEKDLCILKEAHQAVSRVIIYQPTQKINSRLPLGMYPWRWKYCNESKGHLIRQFV